MGHHHHHHGWSENLYFQGSTVRIEIRFTNMRREEVQKELEKFKERLKELEKRTGSEIRIEIEERDGEVRVEVEIRNSHEEEVRQIIEEIERWVRKMGGELRVEK
uniref:Ferredog-Diesel n=1 Tax=synthetic construct TaxID=32630 RepID=UPI0011118679|nr:Chain A, Ferredog-Diesel [synthetic construct]6NUK_B Chain B, Ferredog-Diesel [synthetic construct]